MNLGVLTTGRHDWGILSLLVDALKAAGAHVVIFREVGHTTASASAVYNHVRDAIGVTPLDALILLGDRYETLMAAQAATVTGTPIIHLHGGEVTKGAFDDQIRNAISMLADLHLVSSEDAKTRLEGMGRSNVHLVGAIGTDHAFSPSLPGRRVLEERLGKRLKDPIMLVAVHPETAGEQGVEKEAIRLGRENPGTTVWFEPNLDPGYEAVGAAISQAVRSGDVLISSLPSSEFWGLLRLAESFVGNSSSIVIEAPAIGLRTVLLGRRQQGRVAPMKADGKATERAVQAILDWLKSRSAPSRQAV